jgi:heterodisulfide reductase subunit A-like polyferredoxin
VIYRTHSAKTLFCFQEKNLLIERIRDMTKKITEEQSSVGAVVVAGAGIAGMQAALDLAEAGFKVYLVESGSLGWQQSAKRISAQHFLCSMSAKLLAVQTHNSIELIENATVEGIQGSPGNFLVTIGSITAPSTTGKSRKVKKASSLNHLEVVVGALIFAPGFNALTAPANYDCKSELRTLTCKYGFSIQGKKTAQGKPGILQTTSQPGIFVAGESSAADGSIAGSSVAALAAEFLARRRGSLVSEKQYPPERRVSGEEPCIGVFMCRHLLSDEKEFSGIANSARKLPSVALAEELPYMCSSEALQRIKSAIAEQGLNRVIAVSCNPRAQEALFQEALAEAGLNRYLLEMIDGRSAGQAIDTVSLRMIAARTRLLEPLKQISGAVIQSGLVIGSGLSALSAALSLANQGFDVYLAEQKHEENAASSKLKRTRENADISTVKRALQKQIASHKKIQIFSDARITDFSGHAGSYTTTLSNNGAAKVLNHGIVIVESGQQQKDLSLLMKIPVTADGAFLRPDALLPLDLACGGMFCCGLEDSAAGVSGSIIQGRAAAGRAATILAKRELILSSIVSVVDQEYCVACLSCVRDCPYHAAAIAEEGVAFIEPAECRGCGICVSACPRAAIELKHYTDKQILAQLAALAES